MSRFITKRLIQAIVVILLIAVFSYFLMYLVPGDPVYAILGPDITQEQYDAQFKLMELDLPIYQRFWNWFTRALSGDFGSSYRYSDPVAVIIKQRLPITMYLGGISLIISTIIGIILGTICGTRRGKFADNLITILANLGSVVPGFWLAVIGMTIFSGILPSYGFTFPHEDFAMSIKQTIMPVVCLSVGTLASMTRQMRSGMLEVIRQDYIRTARSKGLKESDVVMHHAMKNAIIPIVTLIGMNLRNIVAGAVTIETIFSITGTGSLLVSSILAKDVPVIQACILVIAVVVVIANLIVDICYGYLDPRIRIQ